MICEFLIIYKCFDRNYRVVFIYLDLHQNVSAEVSLGVSFALT